MAAVLRAAIAAATVNPVVSWVTWLSGVRGGPGAKGPKTKGPATEVTRPAR